MMVAKLQGNSQKAIEEVTEDVCVCVGGGAGLAQVAKYLPCKHEDLNSNPRSHVKMPDVLVHL